MRFINFAHFDVAVVETVAETRFMWDTVFVIRFNIRQQWTKATQAKQFTSGRVPRFCHQIQVICGFVKDCDWLLGDTCDSLDLKQFTIDSHRFAAHFLESPQQSRSFRRFYWRWFNLITALTWTKTECERRTLKHALIEPFILCFNIPNTLRFMTWFPAQIGYSYRRTKEGWRRRTSRAHCFGERWRTLGRVVIWRTAKVTRSCVHTSIRALTQRFARHRSIKSKEDERHVLSHFSLAFRRLDSSWPSWTRTSATWAWPLSVRPRINVQIGACVSFRAFTERNVRRLCVAIWFAD